MDWNETWQDRDALSLIKPGDIDTLAYSAIPSLISSAIINRSIKFHDHPIYWRAAQQDKKLTLVSQPLPASVEIRGGRDNAYIVIQVEFALRTMPRDPNPYIDMMIHTRRYIENANSSSSRKTGTIQIETLTPLIKDWPQRAPVQIPLDFVRRKKNEAYYRTGIDQFLVEVNASQIVSPTELLQEPKAFWNLEGLPNKDGYYLIYHEGTSPNHPFETGFPIGDKQNLYREITKICDGVLEPVDPIQKCNRLFHKDRPTISMHVGDLKDKKIST